MHPGPRRRLSTASRTLAGSIVVATLVIGQIGLMFVRGAGRDSIPGG